MLVCMLVSNELTMDEERALCFLDSGEPAGQMERTTSHYNRSPLACQVCIYITIVPTGFLFSSLLQSQTQPDLMVAGHISPGNGRLGQRRERGGGERGL